MQFHHKSKQNNLTKNWIRNGRMSVDSVKLWKCIIFPTEGIRQYWTFLNHRFEPCNRVYISLAHPSNHFKCNMKKTRKKFNYHKRRDFFSHLFSLIHSRQFRAFNCILEHSLKWIDFLHVLRLALITNRLVWNLLIYFSFPVHFSFTVKQKALIMPLDLCSRCFFFLSLVCLCICVALLLVFHSTWSMRYTSLV